MNKSTGHRYRVRFSLFLWVALIYLMIATPSSAYMVHNPGVARAILVSAMLLTVAFSLFTYIFWVIDRRRESKSHKAGE